VVFVCVLHTFFVYFLLTLNSKSTLKIEQKYYDTMNTTVSTTRTTTIIKIIIIFKLYFKRPPI